MWWGRDVSIWSIQHICRSGATGVLRGVPPDQNLLDFMIFFGNFDKIVCWLPSQRVGTQLYIPKMKIKMKLKIHRHICVSAIFTMHRPRVHSLNQWWNQYVKSRMAAPPGTIHSIASYVIALKEPISGYAMENPGSAPTERAFCLTTNA